MIYRDFAGESCSLLGFGTMRFPTKDGKIDETEAERLLDAAFAAGVNYFDTAIPYHGGESEPFVGRVLSKYPRESYFLATKLFMRDDLMSAEEAVRIFEQQLDRIGVEYVDYYLFHAVHRRTWREKVLGLNLIPAFEKLQSEGKIRHLGFSFHDTYEIFKEIITYRKWDFCQIQYNYLDTLENPGDRGYRLAEELGVPLAIMEPIRGGSLVQVPDDIADELKQIAPTLSLAGAALTWVATHPNARVILSGMSSYGQVEDNLRSLGAFSPFTEAQMQAIGAVAEKLRRRSYNACTECRYCMPCPAGVDIPRTFRHLNRSERFPGTVAAERNGYLSASDRLASLCISCGACERVCPQSIPIRRDLREAVRRFEGE